MLQQIDKQDLATAIDNGLRRSVEEFYATDVVLRLMKYRAPQRHALEGAWSISLHSLSRTLTYATANRPPREHLEPVEEYPDDFDEFDFDDDEFWEKDNEEQEPYEPIPIDEFWDFLSTEVVQECIEHITNVDIPRGVPSLDARTGQTVVYQKIFEELNK